MSLTFSGSANVTRTGKALDFRPTSCNPPCVLLQKEITSRWPQVSSTLNEDGRSLRIALISPKGPLYRHRGGIFQWYGLSPMLLTDDTPLLALAARSGCRGLYSWGSIARRLRVSPGSPWVGLTANMGCRHSAHHLHRFYNCDWSIGSAGVDARLAAASPERA
jgi:hypothetical protein